MTKRKIAGDDPYFKLLKEKGLDADTAFAYTLQLYETTAGLNELYGKASAKREEIIKRFNELILMGLTTTAALSQALDGN